MVIKKIKKLIVWSLLLFIVLSGFLAVAPEKAKAIDKAASDLAGCSAEPTVETDNNDKEITFDPFVITDNGKTISQKVTFRAGEVRDKSVSKTYTFTFESFAEEKPPSETTWTHHLYTYKNTDFPASKLVLDGGQELSIDRLRLLSLNDTGGDQNYKDYVQTLVEKKGTFTSTCSNDELFGNGTFSAKIQFNGDEPPTVRINGNNTLSRPATIFRLEKAFNKSGAATDDVMFYFVYVKNEGGKPDEPFSHFIIKSLGSTGETFLSECGDVANYHSCNDFDKKKKVDISNIQEFWNHVYNSPGSGDKECGTVTTYQSSNPDKNLASWTKIPNIDCLNVDSNGWLAKWGVKINEVSLLDPTGEEDSTCGVSGGFVERSIAKVLCAILQGIGSMGKWLIETLGIETVIKAYEPSQAHLLASSLNPFSVSTASAAPDTPSESSIKRALDGDPEWVLETWKVVLGISNVFVVVILIFLAVANITRIQYDTYAIKKSLPTLIIGILLANFSVLITKMLVDATNVITATFTNGDPGTFIREIITAVVPNEQTGQLGFMTTTSLGGLLLAIFFAFFAIIALLILGFLFYIRYIVILVLTMVAPFAFIAMAFPPTQGLFKQWWGWYAKFIFMKPISIFLIWIGARVIDISDGNSLTAWAIAVFLTYAAIIVPFKLGGAIMSGWAAAGKWASGTGKGGWARKPVDEWWQRRKDQAGAQAKIRFPRLFAGAESDRIKNESIKKAADSALKQKAWERNDVTAWEGKAKGEEDKLKDLINKRTLALEEGKLDLNWWLRLRLVGVKNSGQMAQDLFKNAASLELSTKNLEAHRKDATWGAIVQMGRDNTKLSQQLDTLKGNGVGLDTIEVDNNGKIRQTTLYKLDKNGEVERDASGNPIQDVATYRDYLEGAAFARMSGLAAKDPKVAQNYFDSAAEMERKATDFARTHAQLDDKPILYNAFMDKNKSGRVFSVTTSWILDEISTNTLNENAETMPVRFKNGGYGWRNNRGTHDDLVNLAKGQYSKVSPTAIAPAVAEYRTWLEFIGRKGGKDRGRFLAEFLDNVDNGTVYGEQNKGRLLRSVLDKENSIRQGATDEFLAEAILSAKRRGLNDFGGINIADLGFTKDNTQEVVASLKRKGISSVNAISSHPEIFRQLDLTPSNNTRAQRNMLDGISDLLEESSNFCGAGNPVGYTVKTKDRKEDDLFNDFKPVKESEDIAAIQKRRIEKEERAQRVQTQEQLLASSTPDQIIASSGNAQRAAGEYKEALVDLESSENQIVNNIKINNNPVDLSVFRQQIAQAIQQSVATSFSGLQNELQQQFSGLTIDAPTIDTPEAVIEYKNKVTQIQAGISTLAHVDETAQAETIQKYSPVQHNESIQNLQQSLNQLEEASEALKEAANFISKSANPSTRLPDSVIDKALEALSSRGQIVDLTQTAFKEDETKLGDALNKMVIGLRGAINAKQETGSLNNQAVLNGIKKEIRKTNETMLNIPQGNQTQVGAPPTQPPTPQNPSPTGGQTQSPTPPPGQAPENMGGGGILE